MSKRIKKLQVNFAPNETLSEPYVEDALLTQLMVVVSRVGLRASQLNKNSVIIVEKEI